MSKLLNKPFKVFTLYALIILVCSVPVYYWVVDFIWLDELDEHNLIIKERITNGLKKTNIDDTELNTLLAFWNTIEPGTKIIPAEQTRVVDDSLYTVKRQSLHKDGIEIDRFRGLQSYIEVKGKHYRLNIETNVEETDETLLAIAVITFLFFTLLVGGFILLNRRISGKIWQPFRNTLEKLKLFDITRHTNIQFQKSDIEEFEELNTELSKLIEKNSTAFNQQKTFIENASHELQTPLALLKSKIDLLLQNHSLTGEQSGIINSINTALSRVTRINKNLLLLAKIENRQFADSEPVEISELLSECIVTLSDYAAEKGLKFESEITQHLTINCNITLLEIVINNLLINAVQHSAAQGKVGILLHNGLLSISNAGHEVLPAENIFKRFSQSSAQTANSGLGLAIVKEVSNRYGWQVTYTFNNSLHTFSVSF